MALYEIPLFYNHTNQSICIDSYTLSISPNISVMLCMCFGWKPFLVGQTADFTRASSLRVELLGRIFKT